MAYDHTYLLSHAYLNFGSVPNYVEDVNNSPDLPAVERAICNIMGRVNCPAFIRYEYFEPEKDSDGNLIQYNIEGYAYFQYPYPMKDVLRVTPLGVRSYRQNGDKMLVSGVYVTEGDNVYNGSYLYGTQSNKILYELYFIPKSIPHSESLLAEVIIWEISRILAVRETHSMQEQNRIKSMLENQIGHYIADQLRRTQKKNRSPETIGSKPRYNPSGE